jgi:hypothetical protein
MAKKKNKEQGPFVSLLRPRDSKQSLKLAQQILDGKSPNLDQGLFTRDEYRSLVDIQNKAKEDGKPVRPLPYVYDPVVVQEGLRRNAIFGYAGQPSKSTKSQPANWPSKFGTWVEGMRLSSFRRMHVKDVRKLVSDGALVTVGGHEYVVGLKGGTPAPFNINSSVTGNFGANIRVGKAESYGNEGEHLVTEDGSQVSKTDFLTVVGQIPNKPEVVTFEDGNTITFMPHHRVIWGHLVKSGKAMTTNQIHSLENAKGVTFRPLEKRWVGRGLDPKVFWSAVQRAMSAAATKDDEGNTALDRFGTGTARSDEPADVEANAWRNMTQTQCRCTPRQPYCFGLRHSVVGQAPGTKFATDNKTPVVFFILGGHLPYGLTENKHELKRRVGATEPKAAKAAKPAKPKAAKPAKPKAAKPAKPKAAKPAKPKAAKPAKPKAAKPAKPKATEPIVATPPKPVDEPAPPGEVVTIDPDDDDDGADDVDRLQREAAEADAASVID